MARVAFHPSDIVIEVTPGVTVLKAAQAAGIEIVWCCGGNAICTTCRCLVSVGADRLSPPEPLELEILAAVDLEPPWRLACQAKVIGDVSVEVPFIP
ncbi:MAG TPA: 2Fe-2S iron-sulfur cluster-binding protein [Candidatus Binataceae bacterium]|nr:2Fe-2S iron-sulfur cluster-binding protein [Candidatus Binataceae bacterium]